MRVYFKQCGTISFKFLVDLRFLLLVYKMSTNYCKKLLSKLLTRYNSTCEMKEIMHKYKLWNGYALHDIKRAVDDSFSCHCNII